jgi:dolichol-phosphate mannosyltransferase
MQRALATDADVVCQMDADFSHDPKFLPDLVAATDRYDLVIGSRYLHGISVVNWPLRRLIRSTFATGRPRDHEARPPRLHAGSRLAARA